MPGTERTVLPRTVESISRTQNSIKREMWSCSTTTVIGVLYRKAGLIPHVSLAYHFRTFENYVTNGILWVLIRHQALFRTAYQRR